MPNLNIAESAVLREPSCNFCKIRAVFCTEKECILVSACLLGNSCKYDGEDNDNKDVKALCENYKIIPVCPECMGKLEIPREPSEIRDGRVYSRSGKDVTDNFVRGAQRALELARRFGCRTAVLKEKSPSCGFGKVYDGTFSHTLADGHGIAAKLLYDNGIKIFGESAVKNGTITGE